MHLSGMTDPADYERQTPSTWSRDLGTLRAVADWEAQRPTTTPFGNAQVVALATGLSEELLQDSLRRWERVFPPVLDGLDSGMAEDVYFIGLTERGRRLVGVWPSAEGTVDSIVAALEAAAVDEPDDGKKSRLKGAATVLGSMARDIVVGAVSQTLGQAM